MKIFITIGAVLHLSVLFGQPNTKRILFIGNSYTYYNNLPKLVADMAVSTGDNVVYDSYTLGGYTLQEHATNVITLNKIAIGNWDYVVLQEQSQRPSLPISQVNIEVFPYAHILDSIIKLKNSCAETMFYMTWGRKNGDGSNCGTWPPVCTYNGMDSLLKLRYKMMAEMNKATITPVSVVWKKIRQLYPNIELYDADESHPSEVGSYVAACCFYTTILKKNPLAISFNYTLTAAVATNIKQIVRQEVYDSLSKWNIGKYDPKANFSFTNSGANKINFNNASINANTYLWNFGDGEISTFPNPIHQYNITGPVKIKLIASKCSKSDTTFQIINLNIMQDTISITIFPNPVKSSFTINKKNIGNLNYKIFNALGVNVKEGIVTNTTQQINIFFLMKGLYIIKLFENNKLVAKQKIIKN